MSTHPSTVIQFAFCLCLNLSVRSCRYNPFCGAALVSPWLCQYLCILHLPIVLPTFAHPIVHTQLCASYKAILHTGDTVLPGVRHLTPAGRLPGSGPRWPQIGSPCLPPPCLTPPRPHSHFPPHQFAHNLLYTIFSLQFLFGSKISTHYHSNSTIDCLLSSVPCLFCILL